MDSGALALTPTALTRGRVDVAGTVKDVRADHVARYEWAAKQIAGHVVDAGCNCGYGSAILADRGLSVLALDKWAGGLDWALEHWHRASIVWIQTDLETVAALPECDAVVAFELIEHMHSPRRFLLAARRAAPRLFVSVPNESVWPWEPRLAPEHVRHYTRAQFRDLLSVCGWTQIEDYGQAGPHSPVEPGVDGRTLVAACA